MNAEGLVEFFPSFWLCLEAPLIIAKRLRSSVVFSNDPVIQGSLCIADLLESAPLRTCTHAQRCIMLGCPKDGF